ncbi:MAG: sugar-binding protein [Pyrinomonadaceae bacterium]
MAYDSKNLYMAWKVTQDPSTVLATVARRDNIFNDDYVLAYIDTFNDQRQAYVVFFNPFGIQADGTFTEGRGEDYSVDILMESKGVLTSDGFTIEVAIPFKSLRYEAGKGKNWGLSIFRRVK